MNSATVETATKRLVAKMGKGNARVGIRELALAVEEKLPGVTLDQIHQAVLQVAAFYPSDDPRCEAAKRQEGFGFHRGGDLAPLVWVYR